MYGSAAGSTATEVRHLGGRWRGWLGVSQVTHTVTRAGLKPPGPAFTVTAQKNSHDPQLQTGARARQLCGGLVLDVARTPHTAGGT